MTMTIAKRRSKYETEMESLRDLFHKQEPIGIEVRKFRKKTKEEQIAAIAEGSRLPYSGLVNKILSTVHSITAVTCGLTLHAIGHRATYGILPDDFHFKDIDEDTSIDSLWSWEISDLNLLPKRFHDQVMRDRLWKGNVKERLMALSNAINILEGPVVPRRALRKAAKSLIGTQDEATLRKLTEDPTSTSPSSESDGGGPKRKRESPSGEGNQNKVSRGLPVRGERLKPGRERLRPGLPAAWMCP